MSVKGGERIMVCVKHRVSCREDFLREGSFSAARDRIKMQTAFCLLVLTGKHEMAYYT